MKKFRLELKAELKEINENFELGLLTTNERYNLDFKAKDNFNRILKMIK